MPDFSFFFERLVLLDFIKVFEQTEKGRNGLFIQFLVEFSGEIWSCLVSEEAKIELLFAHSHSKVWTL